jgi:3-oxoacyl-[acyl-carrier-protein] synthase II
VDLPLVPLLLDNYASSGILSAQLNADPYRPGTSGFIPAEGAAAMAVEAIPATGPRLIHYSCNSDASDAVGIPKNGGRTPDLFRSLSNTTQWPMAVCPHATGTAVQAAADPAALARVFGVECPSLHLLKPFLGHTIGASGLLESVIVAAYLRNKCLPPNLPGLHVPSGFTLPEASISADYPVAKLSHGMGGHNALLVLTAE